MGYLTEYKIACDTYLTALNFPYQESYADPVLDIGLEPESLFDSEPEKWYQHEADMRKLSTEHPEITFTLYGEGEEQGDVWIKHFKDGKIKVRKVITRMPTFDEVKWE